MMSTRSAMSHHGWKLRRLLTVVLSSDMMLSPSSQERRGTGKSRASGSGRGLAPHDVVAVAAVDRTVVARQEGHLGLNPAPVADRRKIFARAPGSVAMPAGALRGTAGWAAAGLVGEAFGGIKRLLSGGPHEVRATVAATQYLILVRLHPSLSSPHCCQYTRVSSH